MCDDHRMRGMHTEYTTLAPAGRTLTRLSTTPCLTARLTSSMRLRIGAAVGFRQLRGAAALNTDLPQQ